jgi:hypothetical protein
MEVRGNWSNSITLKNINQRCAEQWSDRAEQNKRHTALDGNAVKK